MPVGKHDVVGVGDAGVRDEGEGGEDGHAAARVAAEGVRPEEAGGAVHLGVGEALGQAAVVSESKKSIVWVC